MTDLQVKSRGGPRASVSQEKMASLVMQSIWIEEGLLDIPFSVEEVKRVVGKLKKGKAAGP